MANKTAILSVRIIGDSASAEKSMKQTETAAGSMSEGIKKSSLVATAALAAVVASAKMVGDAASEAEQAAGGIDAAFGQYAGRVHGWADAAAQAVGLSKDQYGNLAVIIGSQLKNMGLSMSKATDMTDSLIRRGADLAATFGGTTAEAVGALSALLRGERDPIERYGVSIKQADVNARVAAMGMSKLTGDAQRAAETQATLALLTEQTAAATGQFGREADTAAGQQERANAEWRNAQIALGEALLPLMVEMSKVAGDVARNLAENAPAAQTLAVVVGSLAAGVLIMNGAMKVFNALQTAQIALQWAQNVAWLANPITWIVIAIVAAVGLLVAIVAVIAANFDQLKNDSGEVWGAIARFIEPVVNWLREAWEWAGKLLGSFGKLFGAGDQAKSAVSNALPKTADIQARVMMPAGMSLFAAPFQTPTPPTMPWVPGANGTAPTVINNTTNEIHVNGAVDPASTARQLRKILKEDARRNGRTQPTGSLPW